MSRAGLLATALVPAGLLAMAAGCRRPAVLAARATVLNSSEFIGSAACAECHVKESQQCAQTRHAMTMRLATRESLGALAPPIGPIPGTIYAISSHGGELRFGRSDAPDSTRMGIAFGSGVTGMTYAGLFGPSAFSEFRMSYLPHDRKWCTTPGQEGHADLEVAVVHSGEVARKCLLCHAVAIPRGSMEPDPRFFGVGCESCHGPGSAHIAAARAGNSSDLRIGRMEGWDAGRIDAVCARCHRSAADVQISTRDAGSTQRYQPYGLEMSPCFKKSGGRLSCVTCHDPHSNVSTEPRHYEAICLNCHSPALSKATNGTRACPVNPREGCIGCHMPKRRILPGSGVPVTMADHLIWAYAPHRRGGATNPEAAAARPHANKPPSRPRIAP